MDKKATLIITNSYFNVFKVLTDKLNGKTNDLENKNLVFCEEKFSLMAERIIAHKRSIVKFNLIMKDIYIILNLKVQFVLITQIHLITHKTPSDIYRTISM